MKNLNAIISGALFFAIMGVFFGYTGMLIAVLVLPVLANLNKFLPEPVASALQNFPVHQVLVFTLGRSFVGRVVKVAAVMMVMAGMTLIAASLMTLPFEMPFGFSYGLVLMVTGHLYLYLVTLAMRMNRRMCGIMICDIIED